MGRSQTLMHSSVALARIVGGTPEVASVPTIWVVMPTKKQKKEEDIRRDERRRISRLREEKRLQRKAAREALDAAQKAWDEANAAWVAADAAVKAICQERSLYLLTPGQALRKRELLQDLEELKEIKDQHLERKRELEHVIAGYQEELATADAAFREAKANISEVVPKLNKLPRE
ncbi:hypothetical protein IFM53868_05744 [Aspergillus udagawae]|uniref:Uncharacterized protein n=1 Tax=Aspergillus udagawae TaxID=91492 RepID=A0ABQ1AW47_9EURO|nr:hypothetical protein IFM53868_05744 [Aspergillus udagawae]